jgi:DNA-directed RNA polymerase beta' subunit
MIRLPTELDGPFRPATSSDIRSWSFGQVRLPRVVHATDWSDRIASLEDERIFGPVNNYACSCGKWRGENNKNMICDRCGVKLTTNDSRRQRFGHMELHEPIAHPFGALLLETVPVLPIALRQSSSGHRLNGLYEDIIRAIQENEPLAVENAFQKIIAEILPVARTAWAWGLSDTTTLMQGLALVAKETG